MGAVAAIIIRKERDVVDAYRRAGATEPSAAQSPDALEIGHMGHGVAFHRLVRRAVLRDAGDGRYYLDEPSWEALRSMRRRLLLVMLILVLAVFVSLSVTGVIAIRTGIPRLD